MIETFERVSEKKLNYKIVARRLGDVASTYADITKANKILSWKTQHTLDEALLSAWKWQQKIT